MESLDLYPIWHQRLGKGATLRTLELKDLRHFCLEVLALGEILKEHHSEWALSIRAGMMNATEPLSAVKPIMTPEGDIRVTPVKISQIVQRKKPGRAPNAKYFG